MTDYELICPRCGEELVDGKCPKCGQAKVDEAKAFAFTDKDLEQFVEQHRRTIHTQEFPTRCGICRLVGRLLAAERLNATFLEVTDDDSEIDGAVYDAALHAWKKAAGR